MTLSAAKKKIEAIATITNTMMVVIMVSRRVGQVTLAVSERTSCMNLNGLKAIVDLIRIVVKRLSGFRNPNSPLAPSPLLKDEPASGLDCSGDFKAAPDIRQSGPAAGAAMYCGRGQRSRYWEPGAGRGGRAPTCDNRFWRPVLYQLSYTPIGNQASPLIRAVSSISDGWIARAKRFWIARAKRLTP